MYEHYNYKFILFLGFNLTLQFAFGVYIVNLNELDNKNSLRFFIKGVFIIIFDFLIFSNILPIIALISRVLVFKLKIRRLYSIYIYIENWKNFQKYF